MSDTHSPAQMGCSASVSQTMVSRHSPDPHPVAPIPAEKTFGKINIIKFNLIFFIN